MYHIVYLTTNLVNNKIYVGVHSTFNLDDGYLGSGDAIQNAIKKYGKKNFKRQILYYCLTEDHSLECEALIVNEKFLKRSDVYNIKLGGGNKVKFTQETKNKIAKKASGRIVSQETKAKLSEMRKGELNNFYGKTHTDDTKKILSEKSKIYMNNKSPEEIEHMIEHIATFNRGKKHSEEFCKQRSYHRNLQKPPITAKIYLVISPLGEEFIVDYDLAKFAKEQHLSIKLLKDFKNNGKVYTKKHMTLADNTVGWEIRDYNL